VDRGFGVIYSLNCPNTNIIRYIGQTTQNPYLRLKQHLWYSSKWKNHLGYWISSLDIEPSINIIEECKCEDLNSREIFWINYYKENNLVNSTTGYALTGHFKMSEDTKRKIGEATKRIHTGLKRSEETRRKISEAAKNKIRFKKEKKIKENKQKVFLYVYDLESNKIYTYYIKEFANLINVYPNSIQDRIKRYSNKIYRNKYLISKSKDELKILLKQLGIEWLIQ